MSKMVNNQPYKGRIVIHSSVIQEVSKYPKALDAVREYVCNGWDADADRLEITFNEEFLRIEDWGSGISNFDLFWGVGDQHKSSIEWTPKYKRKPIGKKGLGKLSFTMLGDSIDVETRTNYKAEFSIPDFDSMNYEVYQREKLDEVLNHRGTQITIRGIKFQFSKDDLIQYIKENLYGLILPIASKDHPMTIFVNGEKVILKHFSGKEEKITIIPYGQISCNLSQSKSSKIDALYRGVKVREVNPAPTHPAKGYFNVDWVVPTPDRNNFTETKESRAFFPAIKQYILQNIPSKNDDSPRDLEKSIREISKFFDQILRDQEIMPQSMMPVSRTSNPTDLKMGGVAEAEPRGNEPESHETQEQHQKERKRLQHKILKGEERPLKSAYGIIYVTRKAGKDKPAIISYREEKLIIINLDHDLVKNLNELRPLQRNIAIGFLLAKGHFHILETFVDLPRYEDFVDEMVATLLSKMIQ